MMGLTSRPVGNASRWSRNHLSELYGKFFLDMREGLRRRLIDYWVQKDLADRDDILCLSLTPHDWAEAQS